MQVWIPNLVHHQRKALLKARYDEGLGFNTEEIQACL